MHRLDFWYTKKIYILPIPLSPFSAHQYNHTVIKGGAIYIFCLIKTNIMARTSLVPQEYNSSVFHYGAGKVKMLLKTFTSIMYSLSGMNFLHSIRGYSRENVPFSPIFLLWHSK